MKRLIAVALVGAALVLVLALALGCESADSAAARRANAEAALTLAEADAYQTRQQADTEAAAERAAVRQMERDAAHQRTVELLPFIVIIAGGLGLALVVLLVFWDLRQARAASDPAMLLYMRRLELDQAQQWRALAHLTRRSLQAENNERGMILYDEQRQ